MCTESCGKSPATPRAQAREPFWRDIVRIDRLIYGYEKKLQYCSYKKRQCYRILSLWTDYDSWLSQTCERYAWKVRALRSVQTGSMRSPTRGDNKCSSRISDCAPRRTPCGASRHYGHLAKWSSVHATVREPLRKKRKETKLQGGKLPGEQTGVKIKGQRKPRLKCSRRRGHPFRRGNPKVGEDAEGGDLKRGHSLEGAQTRHREASGVDRQQEEKDVEEAAEKNRKDGTEDNREELYENKGELPAEADRMCKETGGREADRSEGIHRSGKSTIVEREGAHEAVEEGKTFSSQEEEKEEETGHCQMVHKSVGEKNKNSLERVPSGIGGCPHKMGADEEKKKKKEERKKKKKEERKKEEKCKQHNLLDISEEDKQHDVLDFSEVLVREITLEGGDIQVSGSPEGGQQLTEVMKEPAKEKRARAKEKKTKSKKVGDKMGDTKEKMARKRERKKDKAKGMEKEKPKQKKPMMEEEEEKEKASEENMAKAKEKMDDEGKGVKMEDAKEGKMENATEEKLEEVKDAKMEENRKENIGDEEDKAANEGKEDSIEVEKETTLNEGKKDNVEGKKEQREEEVEDLKVEKETEEEIESKRNGKLDVGKEATMQEEGEMYKEEETQMKMEEETQMKMEPENTTKLSEDSSIGKVTKEKIGDEGEQKVDAEKEQNIGDGKGVNSGDEKEENLGAEKHVPKAFAKGEPQRSDHENEPGKTAENEIVHHILSEYSNTIQYTSFLDYIKNKKSE
ncbi:hypothetical protein C922_02847 [Plasmodium inui San Antonio 1]|uniref:Uncharacterized protein n=1 Tax=Plasmodium inui San Antonio 1 TaxID=1237626 RepID=W7A0Y5_9APIC|nr:hypothetical protein C922_02847 [Plasmodium inui San Antonio 1]EUD66862.1 hypothetical protein C922_02847 [Plasmodium inui San Antonio 1]